MADESNREAKDSSLTDALKRILVSGISGALMTEDMIRSYLQEVKLPKELIQLVLQTAAKQKDELQGKVLKELSSIFNKIDWVKEASKFAESHKFRVTAEIEIIKKPKEEEKPS
jgi:hypothetical protein